MNKRPTGFVAICQCGNIVGALDYNQTDRSECGKLLGEWLHYGCTIGPRFGSTWSANVGACECAKEAR